VSPFWTGGWTFLAENSVLHTYLGMYARAQPPVCKIHIFQKGNGILRERGGAKCPISQFESFLFSAFLLRDAQQPVRLKNNRLFSFRLYLGWRRNGEESKAKYKDKIFSPHLPSLIQKLDAGMAFYTYLYLCGAQVVLLTMYAASS